MPFEVRLYRTPLDFETGAIGAEVRDIGSQHQVLRLMAYALGGVRAGRAEQAPAGNWPVAEGSSADQGWSMTLGRFTA